jgi:hypothetical protein
VKIEIQGMQNSMIQGAVAQASQQAAAKAAAEAIDMAMDQFKESSKVADDRLQKLWLRHSKHARVCMEKGPRPVQ